MLLLLCQKLREVLQLRCHRALLLEQLARSNLVQKDEKIHFQNRNLCLFDNEGRLQLHRLNRFICDRRCRRRWRLQIQRPAQKVLERTWLGGFRRPPMPLRQPGARRTAELDKLKESHPREARTLIFKFRTFRIGRYDDLWSFWWSRKSFDSTSPTRSDKR